LSWTTQNPLNIAPGGDGKQTGFTKLKNEFSSIYTKLSTFISESTGHTHDGTTDGGALINLSSIVVDSVLNESVGSAIASASTINLTTATGNFLHITGNTAITAVTLGAGMRREVVFDGILTLAHHSTNNNLPGTADITTASGDMASYYSDGTTVYCTKYTRSDGNPLKINNVIKAELNASGSAPIYACRAWVNFNGVPLTGTYSQTGTSVTVTMTGHGLNVGENVNLSPTSGTGVAGSYIVDTVVNANVFTYIAGTSLTTSGNITRNIYIRASGNISSIVDNGTGDYTVNFITAMPSNNFSAIAISGRDSDGTGGNSRMNSIVDRYTTTYVRIATWNIYSPDSAADAPTLNIAVFC
jgi:hypothetical protein